MTLASRQRAADGLEKAWHDQPANKIMIEKRKLTAIHEKQISAGKDAKALQQAYEYIRRKSNVNEKQKINLHLDRFLKVTSSMTTSACQRDLSEANFHIFTFGINVQKPANFHLPSSYLAHTIFPEDIRIDENGHQWANGQK